LTSTKQRSARTNNGNSVNGQLEKYVRTLLDSGLVRRIATPEGARYEVTETGSRFFKEYEETRENFEAQVSDLGQTEFGRILDRLIKDQVTVVLPVLNEAEALNCLLEEIRAESFRNILVVDGYSSDGTPEIARSAGVSIIYQHGAGKAGAIRTAIEHVETPHLLVMDGDSTYDPKDIWRLLAHDQRYTHVVGVRDRKYIPRLHRFGNWLISRVFSALFGVRISDVCSGMYLLETDEARKYDLEEPGFVAEIELAAQSASRETLTEVPINYRPRTGSRKLDTWNHGFAILSAAFTLARRYNPILLYSSLAGLFIFPAALVLGWVALEQLAAGVWHSGWALLGMMFLLVAVQAFTLASVSILMKNVEKTLARQIRAALETNGGGCDATE
jgi:glycosyltransferase involved in cell wall biosynthesis